jgi:hypothetical protein
MAELRAAILQIHGCESVYFKMEHVHETFQGKTVWERYVEVFNLVNHPKAKRAYAWAQLDGPKDDQTRFIAILELPPVKDAKTAVQASIKGDSEPLRA